MPITTMALCTRKPVDQQNFDLLMLLNATLKANEYVFYCDAHERFESKFLLWDAIDGLLMSQRPKAAYFDTGDAIISPFCRRLVTGPLDRLSDRLKEAEGLNTCQALFFSFDLFKQVIDVYANIKKVPSLRKIFVRESFRQTEDIVTVVVAMNDRRNSDEFFSKLAASHAPDGFTIDVHIANNNSPRQNELTALAKVRSTENVKFTIHEFAKNEGGMARFLLVRELMVTSDIKFVIFLDDDQYVRGSTILDLWMQRRHLSMVGWFGKLWMTGASKKEYWRPTFGLPEVLKHEHTNNEWHYVGTGLSVVDTLIFSARSVFYVPERYYFIEDLWLSFILKINHWKRLRAFVEVDLADEQWLHGQSVGMVKLKPEMFTRLNACPIPLVD